jgi:AraC-like DNA-binding protein/mannose-6-phosphate isomerase-like protein (cupin superfamily)
MCPKPPSGSAIAPGFPKAHLTAESTPRPVVALADSLARGTVIPPHSHRRAQLIFAIAGTMTIRAGDDLWMLPPSHALWVPVGVVHQIRTSGSVEMRTLYIQPGHAQRIGRDCHVVFVSPLLRELILRAMELPPLYDERGMAGRVMKLILDEVARLPAQPLSLRMPRDARLRRLCTLVLQDLAAGNSIVRRGAGVGLSERSVIRLFPKQTGLTFHRWLNQARLLRAFELLDAGHSLTRIAVEVGYSGPSAFAKMCRRTLGKAPSELRVTP